MHGTTPELIYQRQPEISADKVDVSTGIGRRSSMPSTDTRVGARDFSCAVSGFGQVLEKTQGKKRAMMKLKTQLSVILTRYQSMTTALMKSKSRKLSAAVLELDRASTFLDGVSTRFGRQVRINNRLIS